MPGPTLIRAARYKFAGHGILISSSPSNFATLEITVTNEMWITHIHQDGASAEIRIGTSVSALLAAGSAPTFDPSTVGNVVATGITTTLVSDMRFQNSNPSFDWPIYIPASVGFFQLQGVSANSNEFLSVGWFEEPD